MDKQSEVLRAIRNAKKRGATALKIECEAQFGRNSNHGDYHTCSECQGNYEGTDICDTCEGEGYVAEDSDGTWHGVAEGTEEDVEECGDCYGYGRTNCSHCDEGEVECTGDCCDDENWSDEDCQEYMVSKLAERGLIYDEHIVFAKFYNDGSVDSEFTITIGIDHIDKAPIILEVFKQLGEAIDNDFDVAGAGMHMAFLFSPDGSYNRHDTPNELNRRYYENFKQSMTMLMPALFFLASSNETSRGLGYRNPAVGYDTHRCAIDYRGRALEFRLFDTCYENPEAILDNFVVMSKCLDYWREDYKPSGLEKISQRIRFGNDKDRTLGRFYTTEKHFDLLNVGLLKLKPSYYTISEIKQQRKFNKTKRSTKKVVREYAEQLPVEYEEYAERRKWADKARKMAYMSDLFSNLRNSLPSEPEDEVIARVEATAEERLRTQFSPLEQLDDFVRQKLEQFQNELEGDYTLEVRG